MNKEIVKQWDHSVLDQSFTRHLFIDKMSIKQRR